MNAIACIRHSKLLLASLCAATLLAAGCSSIDRSLADVTRSDEGVRQDRHGDRFTFADEPLPASVAVGAPDPLPTDFPADVYRPETYDLLDSSDGDGLRRVQLRVDGTTARLGEQARMAMLRQGWRQVMSRQRGDSHQVMAWVKDGRTAVLLFDHAGLGEVRVAVQWRPTQAPHG